LSLNQLEKQLLNDFQREFPLTPAPYREIAQRLGIDESTVINSLQALVDRGLISRIGPVFRVNGVGVSTLAAMAVPESLLDKVADQVSSFKQVNHNYEREHEFNLWFVITACNNDELNEVIRAIENQTGIEVLQLPMLEAFHIDLGFELQWQA